MRRSTQQFLLYKSKVSDIIVKNSMFIIFRSFYTLPIKLEVILFSRTFVGLGLFYIKF